MKRAIVLVLDSFGIGATDDADQFAELTSKADEGSLFARNLIQTFGPDTLAEARNRGFTPRR